jgi:hypothetical protein
MWLIFFKIKRVYKALGDFVLVQGFGLLGISI